MHRGASGVAESFARALGSDRSIAITAYDGSRAGPSHAPPTVHIGSPRALQRMASAPGELGLGRAVVAGDIIIDGDIYAVLAMREGARTGTITDRWRAGVDLLRDAGLGAPPWRAPPSPPEEAGLRGRRHSKRRDAEAISHHYDVSNDFYRLVLGESMTYSCAVWASPDISLATAQDAKPELICRKLGLTADQRLLDVGCGWGSMLIHAARHHGVRGVGVTLSSRQTELARRRVAQAGISDRVEIRQADYRDVDDGPYDAISSIGMFEHIGAAHLDEYFGRLHSLLRPGSRLLNHGITTPARSTPVGRVRFRLSFVGRYVFPDGELHEVGKVVSRTQASGLEVRHVESLREHYALTLRQWVTNLEAHWDEAVELVGARRARVWRLFIAGSALGFENGRISVHQTLAVRPTGRPSELPLRPDWDVVSPESHP